VPHRRPTSATLFSLPTLSIRDGSRDAYNSRRN
jgi:hypothetical protein